MKYFPAFLDVHKLRFLVIGSGKIALAKIETLLEFCGVESKNITVIIKDKNEEISKLILQLPLNFIFSEYKKEHLKDFDVIISATDDKKLNEQIALHADKKLINIVDEADLSNFIFGSFIKEGDITISFNSSGNSPVLSRYLKRIIKSNLPKNLRLISEFAKKNKNFVKEKLVNIQARRIFWEEFFENYIHIFEEGEIDKAQHILEQKLINNENKIRSEIYFISAGPGDPELITIKAIKYLSKADVILYDRLVSEDILNYGRKDAIKINVGKTKDLHRYTQDQINELMVKYAKEGNIVARLKGGDGSFFARLCEEVEIARKYNIDFKIIPGVTSASGAAASVGISLTSRNDAKAVRFITIYKDMIINDEYWQELAKTSDTLVFYMSTHNIEAIIDNLLRFNKIKETPILVIEQATTHLQRNYLANLNNFKEKFKDKRFLSPSIVIMGNVANVIQSDFSSNDSEIVKYFKDLTPLPTSRINAYEKE